MALREIHNLIESLAEDEPETLREVGEVPYFEISTVIIWAHTHTDAHF